MGIKGIIIACFLIITVIFSSQNMQNITLVFFGINTISLPLSFAVLIFVFLGLLSSFFIQFLAYLSKGNSPNNFSNKRQYSPPSPAPIPTVNDSEYSYTRKETLREENLNKKVKTPKIEINQEPIYQDLEEEIKPIFNENRTVVQSENLESNQQNYKIPFMEK